MYYVCSEQLAKSHDVQQNVAYWLAARLMNAVNADFSQVIKLFTSTKTSQFIADKRSSAI